jgi:hypothetical protein
MDKSKGEKKKKKKKHMTKGRAHNSTTMHKEWEFGVPFGYHMESSGWQGRPIRPRDRGL